MRGLLSKIRGGARRFLGRQRQSPTECDAQCVDPIPLLVERIARDPLVAHSYYELAIEYFRLGRWFTSIALCRSAMTLGGRLPHAELLLANNYLQLGEFSLARDALVRLCADSDRASTPLRLEAANKLLECVQVVGQRPQRPQLAPADAQSARGFTDMIQDLPLKKNEWQLEQIGYGRYQRYRIVSEPSMVAFNLLD